MNSIVPDTVLDELLPPFPEREDMRAFAILDAARDARIHRDILGADCEWMCLYRGDAADTMATVAPYLVQLDRASWFTKWVLEEGWGDSWGIFLNAAVPMDVLRTHFRRFVMVQLPDDRLVYFRFYDPRVLRAYLPTCTPDERATFFGPVDRFVMEDGEGNVIVFPAEGVDDAPDPS